MHEEYLNKMSKYHFDRLTLHLSKIDVCILIDNKKETRIQLEPSEMKKRNKIL